MTDEKDISIVIVSWNAREYLLACIASCLEDTGHLRSEIIVVDNASSDGSAEAVQERFPGVIVHRNAGNTGFARANNIGMARSRGRYVLLVNSDVEVRRGCFQGMFAFMENHQTVGMLGPRILNTDGSLQRSCKRLPTLSRSFCRAMALDRVLPGLTFHTDDEIRPVEALSGCFWMVRRAALDEVGLLDETFFMYAEDLDWCKRFDEHGWSVIYFPEVEAVHHGGGSSSNAPIRFAVEQQRARLQYWRKHHGAVSLCLFRSIALLHQGTRLCGGALRYLLQRSRREDARFKMRRSVACIHRLAGNPE